MVLVRSAIDIRTYNLCRIIFHLSRRRELCRKDLQGLCGLSPAAVYNLCGVLRKESIVEEAQESGERKKNSGRTPKPIRLTRSYHYFIVISVRKVNDMTISLMRLNGEHCTSATSKVSCGSLDTFIEGCAASVDGLLEQSGVSRDRIRRCGIVLSGIFDERWKRTRGTTWGLFENIDLKSLLERELKIPVSIENDANLAAFYTYLFSDSQPGISTLAYILLDEGIGSGIVIDDKLYTGESGYATEICCLPLGHRTPGAHFCGMHDCAEEHLKIGAFYSALREEQGKEPDPALGADAQWSHCLNSLKNPDDEPAWQRVLEKKGKLLGTLCSIVMMIFDIRTLVFGGRAAELVPKMKPFILKEYKKRTIASQFRDIEILVDPFYEETIRGGANGLAVTEWLTDLSERAQQ